MASKAETFQTKKLANGFILSNHENEKSQLINMTKNCEKTQVAKIRQTYDFSQFSQILLINMTKNCEKSQLARKIVSLK